jgi:hypothetical protein
LIEVSGSEGACGVSGSVKLLWVGGSGIQEWRIEVAGFKGLREVSGCEGGIGV